jgi:DNA repair photolyase
MSAGFTHSLSPARNCTFGCSYCYVPTLGIYGGLRAEDIRKWGQFTTYKSNSALLLKQALRANQTIYCSPLVDPYQPAEDQVSAMPGILEALAAHPPRVFVLQTRGPLVLRDLDLLLALRQRTTVRVSFSVSTNRESVRRRYEPHCAPLEERWSTIQQLRAAGIDTYATLAPLLPCDPEELLATALEYTSNRVIGDALHVRSVKARGATTRAAAAKIAAVHDESAWFEPGFQSKIIARMTEAAKRAGRQFGTGPGAFGWLAESN